MMDERMEMDRSFLDGILSDILTCRLQNALEMVMRMRIGGVEPDSVFMNGLVRLIASDSSDNAFRILFGMLERNMYVDRFKDGDVMTKLISYMERRESVYARRIASHARRLIAELARRRPGILIRYYLDNPNKFNAIHSRKGECVNGSFLTFENIVFKLSARIAKDNPEYGARYHVKVVDQYESRWTRQSHME